MRSSTEDEPQTSKSHDVSTVTANLSPSCVPMTTIDRQEEEIKPEQSEVTGMEISNSVQTLTEDSFMAESDPDAIMECASLSTPEDQDDWVMVPDKNEMNDDLSCKETTPSEVAGSAELISQNSEDASSTVEEVVREVGDAEVGTVGEVGDAEVGTVGEVGDAEVGTVGEVGDAEAAMVGGDAVKGDKEMICQSQELFSPEANGAASVVGLPIVDCSANTSTELNMQEPEPIKGKPDPLQPNQLILKPTTLSTSPLDNSIKEDAKETGFGASNLSSHSNGKTVQSERGSDYRVDDGLLQELISATNRIKEQIKNLPEDPLNMQLLIELAHTLAEATTMVISKQHT